MAYEKVSNDIITSCQYNYVFYGASKIEKAECDTANYDITVVLSCPQSKDILYRAAKEWLATHIQNFQ